VAQRNVSFFDFVSGFIIARSNYGVDKTLWFKLVKYVENGWKKGLNTHYIKKCDEKSEVFRNFANSCVSQHDWHHNCN
jgi:hypothetical protein